MYGVELDQSTDIWVEMRHEIVDPVELVEVLTLTCAMVSSVKAQETAVFKAEDGLSDVSRKVRSRQVSSQSLGSVQVGVVGHLIEMVVE